MADPLNTLRQCYMNDKDISVCENNVIIGEFSWPKNVKTNYLMWGSGKDGTPKDYYTLECLVFFLRKLTYPHSMYVRQAAAENIPVVRRPDRKELLSFLTGEAATTAAIDKSVPIQPVPPTRVKRPAGEDAAAEWGGDAKRARALDTRVQRARDHMAARLDAPREASVTVDNIKSLSEAMSVEKIAAIKAKRLAKKRSSIKGSDDVAVGADVKEVLDFDVDLTKSIVSRERRGRTRATILQSSGKMFAKSVLAILHSIRARELGKQESGGGAGAAGRHVGAVLPPGVPTITRVPAASGPVSASQPGTYNRYDQERFLQQKKETEGFKIDTMGTYHGMTLESVTCGKSPRRPLAPAPVYAPPPPALPVYAAVRPARGAGDEVGGSLHTSIMKRVSRTPVIVIPSAGASLISMYNAKDILQDLRYVSSEVRRAEGARREGELLLQRRKEGALTVPYRVIDNPCKLAPADWDRVVAVFVMGPAWQFKGWPWDGNPVEIFSKICAFHVKYDEIKLDGNVAKWAVHVIELSRTKRHLDRAALKVFWEKLDKHMIKHKPHLRF